MSVNLTRYSLCSPLAKHLAILFLFALMLLSSKYLTTAPEGEPRRGLRSRRNTSKFLDITSLNRLHI